MATVALPAFGQSAEVKAGARTAANQGLEAFKNGNYQEAVDRFRRANELIKAPTHTLFIARGYEKMGDLVAAREAYLEVDREELSPSAPKAFRTAQKEARDELAALEPRIPYLTIELRGPGAAEAKVSLDGDEVPRALVGLEQPVNPGEHALRAQGEDVRSKPIKVNIAEGERATVTLRLIKLATKPPPPPVEPIDKPQPKPEPTGGGSTLQTVGWIALGVGVVGGGVGTVYLLQKNADKNDADKLYKACNPRVCSPSERDRIAALDSDAASATQLSTAGFIVGGVGIVAGVTLLIVGSSASSDAKPEPASETAKVQPWLGLGSAGLAGTF